MRSFTIHTVTTHGALGLTFEIAQAGSSAPRLVCIGESQDMPDIIVQAYDPAHDIAYRAPTPLTPVELEEESHIHIPPSLRNQIDRGVLASSLGSQVLMQYTEKLCPAISSLPALRAVLESTQGVNAAIIEANSGAFAIIHRAANSLEAYLTKALPEAPAELILLSGSDEIETQYDSSVVVRNITIEDFANICQFTEEGFGIVAEAPQYYTLAIGAARVYFDLIHS